MPASWPASGGGGGGTPTVFDDLHDLTVDTAQDYRMILFADGTVKAIPVTALVPAAPTGLSVDVSVALVRVGWTPAPGAPQTIVYRNGVEVARPSTGSYNDLTVVTGQTYNYAVQAIDPYGQRSVITSTVAAFVNPALNVSPTVGIRSWPTVIPTGGKAFIRVGMKDPDGQTLAATLGVLAGGGSLAPTADPSVYVYTAP